jgi:glucosamine 6-phosphate synthetase-like amidotransferase/phosphosugar isomerase protein
MYSRRGLLWGRYLGKKQAAEILIGGLARLEYRGYDSAGLAIVSEGKMIIKKKVHIESIFVLGSLQTDVAE